MSEFTHYRAALRTALFGNLALFKSKFGLKTKPTSRVMGTGMAQAVERYSRICKTILQHIPEGYSIEGSIVSEIGCGDCFAAADMMLGLGAKHVHLVEYLPLDLMDEHRVAIQALVGLDDLPNRGDLFAPESPPRLDPDKATYHQGLLENIRLPGQVDLLYSFDVLEHVEDLDGFFSYCKEVIRPGGIMLHKFDLSGHGLFEDPMPPLDFQTFPRWLYDLIFVKYNRAVGNFADEFTEAMTRHGFEKPDIIPLRVADTKYLDAIWPHLRSGAHQRSKATVGLLDLVVTSIRR